jgi:ATP-binding cassette subfamily B protein IrtA
MYAQSVVLAFLGVLAGLVPYGVISIIVRDLLAGSRDLKQYLFLLGWITVAWILRVLLHTASTKRSHQATFQVLGNVRKRLCDKLSRLPLGSVLQLPSGALKNTIVERVDSMETALAHLLPEVTANVLAPVFLFSYLLIVDWRLALVSLAPLFLGLLSYARMMRGYETNFTRYITKTKVLNDTAVEYIHGIEVIKAFGRTDQSYGRFVTAAKEAADSCIDWMRACLWPMALALSVAPETLLFVIPVGGIFLLQGTLTTATFIQSVILAFGLVTPLITVMSYTDDLGKARVIFSEVQQILDLEEMHRPATSVSQPKGMEIRMDRVRFGYGSMEVLHGIDLSIPSGSFTALVGPSGSGKSTIARLIASLWDVGSGSIRIGSVDLKDLSLDDANRLVAFVSQDSFLFDGTVRENLRMGNPQATDAMVEQVAIQSGCMELVSRLEHGFDTVVGGGGTHLSGGERQRLCIARAMLKDAPIVILDEATAYTDPENEAVIQRSVARLVQGKTLIVIAHRLSTVMDADQIVVVDGGRVVARGTHQDLLESSPLYHDMWEAHMSVKDTISPKESV